MMPPDGDPISINSNGQTTDLLSPGQTIGEYKVMRCLFYSPLGGFYVLHSVSHGSLCSAYVFPMAVTTDPQFTQRFRDFSSRIANITHPNVLLLKRPEIIENRHCLIYDAIEGVSAENYLEELTNQKRDSEKLMRQTKQPFVRPEVSTTGSKAPHAGTPEFYAVGLAPERSRVILGQIAVALKMAHDQGLHHYTLTLNHVVLGSNDHTQVWGLGIYEMIGDELFQRLISMGVPPLKSTQRRRVTNPVDYLPPEVRRGAKLDARSDVYAIGLSGYQLVTGLKLAGEYVAPSQVNTAIPATWDNLVAGCLQNEPANRLPTVGAVLSSIQAMAPKEVTTKNTTKAKGLDKIPLPAAFGGNASPKNKKTIRLAILGVFGLVVAFGAYESFQILTSPNAASNQGSTITRVAPGGTPDLNIHLNVPSARATFTGTTTGSILVSNGELALNLPRGDYNVSLESPNFKTITTSITVSRETKDLSYNFSPNFGIVQVNGPIGARLYTIPTSGLKRYVGQITEGDGAKFTENLFSRQYDLEVSMPGYEPQNFPQLTLSNKETVLEAKLIPIPARLNVLSEPPGVTVTVFESEKSPTTVGITPIVATNLPVNTPISISVSHPLYRTRTIKLNLRPGQDDSLDFGALEPKTGDLGLKVSLGGFVPDSTEGKKLLIKIDDIVFQWGSGRISGIPAGERKIEITHPDYKKYSETVNIPDGNKVDLVANLIPKPGLLTITLTNDLPFEVAIDGQIINGNGNVFDVPPGNERQVEVRVKDYYTVKRTLSFGPNESMPWTVTAERIPMPSEGKNYTVPYLDATMIWIPEGTYKMGSPLSEQARVPNENDGRSLQPTVTFTKGFWMEQYEVNQREYQYITGKNPSQFKDARKPVESVTWYDAVAYARRVTENERKAGRLPSGYVYRLPTQSEWEYVCRAGSTTPFSWGEEADPTRGNFKGVYPREIATGTVSSAELLSTAQVGSYPPNQWGIYDMHGNVKEWCVDPFNERYPSGTLTDWTGETSGTNRPLRGGGWTDSAASVRSAARDRVSPSIKQNSIGIRLVLGREIAEEK